MLQRDPPARPRLRDHLLVAASAADELFVLAEDRAWLWHNRVLGRVVPLLDGTRDLAGLFDALSPDVTPPEAMYVLSQLETQGLLVNGPPGQAVWGEAEDAPFWHALGATHSTGAGPGGAVCLTAAGPGTESELLARSLGELGVQVVSGDAALRVVVTDHYLRDELAQPNSEALATGKPWMLCKLRGTSLWVGPVFRPGVSGCLECLAARLRRNRALEERLRELTGDRRLFETSSALPSAARLAALWGAQEVALWLAGQTGRLEGRLWSLNWLPGGPETSFHEVVRRPQCPACGDPAILRRRSLCPPLGYSAVASTDQGGFRVEVPEMTLRRLRRHISPITGIVAALFEGAEELDGLCHTARAVQHFDTGAASLERLAHAQRTGAGGKGTTAVQAQASALAEAAERYCGVFEGDEPVLRATYREIRDRAVHPARCLCYSEQQYANRDALNAGVDGLTRPIPLPLPDDLPIDWVSLASPADGAVRYLPAAYCYYGHPDAREFFFCTGEPNGCAAGTAFEEAVLQAMLELIERDSVAIWWYNRLSRPALDLEEFDLPYARQLRAAYARRDRELWALDLTADTGVPTFAAVSHRVGGPSEDITLGFGTHLNPSIALLRALTELNQFFPAVSRVGPSGHTVYDWPDPAAVRFWCRETLATQAQLRPDWGAPPRRPCHFADTTGADIHDAIGACLDAFRRLGLEVLVLDQSRPDVELCVVRVVVPGLRHFWRRLGPGRLYDVPARLGWLPSPRSEGEMNPTSLFF